MSNTFFVLDFLDKTMIILFFGKYFVIFVIIKVRNVSQFWVQAFTVPVSFFERTPAFMFLLLVFLLLFAIFYHFIQVRNQVGKHILLEFKDKNFRKFKILHELHIIYYL